MKEKCSFLNRDLPEHTNKPMNKCLIFVADLEETCGVPKSSGGKVFFKRNFLALRS
jgi:hypothetical protein